MAGQSELTGPDLRNEGIAVATLTAGVPRHGHFDGEPVAVVLTPNGVHAVGGRCSHYGGPLGDGLCVKGEIRCPWHHAAFDLATGEAVGAPALDPIPVYRTNERDGRVFVVGPEEAVVPPRTPPSAPDSVVILGAGAGGAAAAEALRRYGYDGPITLIGSEPPVDRPNLSKDFLAGTAPEDWLPLRSREFYADAGIDLITGLEVKDIDLDGRTIGLDSNRRLSYGALLLATGAEPRRLDIPGADRTHVHYLRSRDDSEAIVDALDGVRRAVVIGAGFIGLEVAASLRQRDIAVTVVAPADIPLGHALGKALGQVVAGIHVDHGVEFCLGRAVTEIGARSVTMDDGTMLPADLVVVGIGAIPRTRLAEAAGLDVKDGIVVDGHLRTSKPHVWAAGDVARFPGLDGELVRIEHWVVAERQGQAAARNILGHNAAFQEPPFFWSQHYDVPVNVTGNASGWDNEIVNGQPLSSEALVGFEKDGRLVAVASIHRDRDSLRAEEALATNDQATLRALFAG
jgi:NADPH-dependent 2,4-dienoyl-CoA reductase/sulfur reductase-like enzyme/nitrite reductase/ring-hydroxylating ferredoxin subunit